MLLLALLWLLLAMVFLYLEIREYGGFGAVGGPMAVRTTIANALKQGLA
jgi:hypothetical protein